MENTVRRNIYQYINNSVRIHEGKIIIFLRVKQ